MSEQATIDEAITHLVQQKLPSSLIVNESEDVLGLVTARDLLRSMAKYQDKCAALPRSVQEAMTPIQRMVYCSPHDSVRRCRQVMSELKIRNLPILDGKAVVGILNIRDISDFTFKAEELGGKQAFLKNVAVRKGLPLGTKLVDFDLMRPADVMQMDVAVSAIPHPFKCADGSIGANLRDFGGRELASDMSVSEDAYFAGSVPWPTKAGARQDILAVADGVGAWREFGVDPRQYAKTLIDNVQKYVTTLVPHSIQDPQDTLRPPLKPIDIMAAAWTMTNDSETVSDERWLPTLQGSSVTSDGCCCVCLGPAGGERYVVHRDAGSRAEPAVVLEPGRLRVGRDPPHRHGRGGLHALPRHSATKPRARSAPRVHFPAAAQVVQPAVPTGLLQPASAPEHLRNASGRRHRVDSGEWVFLETLPSAARPRVPDVPLVIRRSWLETSSSSPRTGCSTTCIWKTSPAS